MVLPLKERIRVFSPFRREANIAVAELVPLKIYPLILKGHKKTFLLCYSNFDPSQIFMVVVYIYVCYRKTLIVWTEMNV